MQKPITSIPKSGKMGKNESVSIDVRSIDNGYVTRRSQYGDGTYSSTESYSKEKPSLAEMPTSNSMKAAVDYLNKRG